MPATHADYAVTALTLWREDRSGGTAGMAAVACVIRNRVHQNNSTFYTECVKKWQFSAMTATSDPELTLWPAPADPQWVQAQQLAGDFIDASPADITNGATHYFALSMPQLPSWAQTMRRTCVIGGQAYYR